MTFNDNDWIETTLGEICSVSGGNIQTGPFGSQLHASDYVEVGIPSIMPKNISVNGVLENDIARITIDDAERLSKYRVQEFDIVYSRRGDVEKCALITDKEDGWLCGTGCLRIRLGKESLVSAEFLHAYLSLPNTREWISRHAVGATMPNLNTSILKAVPIVIPPKKTRGSAENLWSNLNNKINLNSETNQTLEQIAQAIFKSWFVDFEPTKSKIAAREALLAELSDASIENNVATTEQIADAERQAAIEAVSGISGAGDIVSTEQLEAIADLFPNQLVNSELGEIPENWEITPFSKLTKLTKGKNITKKTVVEGIVPVVAGGLSPAYYHNKANVIGPVITVSASGANAGYVNMYFTDIWASDCSFISSKATKYLYTNYVLLKLKQKLITSMQTGAAQPHIYPKDFDRLNVINPGNKMFEIIEDIFSSMFNKIKNNELENTSLGEIRDILLPKLLSGDLPLECDN